MAARAEWKQAGSPRQRSNTFYMKYKQLKCEYRREQRRAAWEFQRKEFNDIGNLQDLNNERLIKNKARGKNKKIKKCHWKSMVNLSRIQSKWQTLGQTILKH